MSHVNSLHEQTTKNKPTQCTVGLLVSGDLTHAKLRNEQFSQQFEEEWKTYNDVLRKTGVREKVPWLDIRGNHGT